MADSEYVTREKGFINQRDRAVSVKGTTTQCWRGRCWVRFADTFQTVSEWKPILVSWIRDPNLRSARGPSAPNLLAAPKSSRHQSYRGRTQHSTETRTDLSDILWM